MGRAAELVGAHVAETLTCYAFPDGHWIKIRTNNPLERIMREIRRRTRVVGAFPDGQSCLNLAAARLRHIAGTQWSTRKYMEHGAAPRGEERSLRSRRRVSESAKESGRYQPSRTARCSPSSGGSATRAWSRSAAISTASRTPPGSASSRSQNHPREVRIFEDGRLIASHPLLEGRNPRRTDPAHRKPVPARRGRPSRRARASDAGRSPSTTPWDDAWRAGVPHRDRTARAHPHQPGRAAHAPRPRGARPHAPPPRARRASALEAIDGLLAEEHANRESRRIAAALKTARLHPPKTLEGFDFSFQPSLDRNRIFALAELDFVARAEVLHFLGPPGIGKSHLATALGVAAVKAGKAVYRCTLAELIEALGRAEREGRLSEKLRFFSRASLLIVDGIGYLPITSGGANLFFQLVNARYEKGAMILTSNRGFAEWGEVFGDPVAATAPLERLLHHAVVVQIEGASYRLRAHADLIPEHTRAHAAITPPPPPKRRGRPPKNGAMDH
jgi:DNA replication protein DnaC